MIDAERPEYRSVPYQIFDLTEPAMAAAAAVPTGFYFNFPDPDLDGPGDPGSEYIDGPYPTERDACMAAIGFINGALVSFAEEDREIPDVVA